MSLFRVIPGFASCGILRPRTAAPSQDDRALVQRVAGRARDLRDVSDGRMRELLAELRNDVSDTGLTDDTINRTFALVNESVRRQLGYEYYEVQLLAGLALVRGSIAEMATGEGKTLVQALAAAAFALRGCGVHIMTSNAYLAARDFDQLEPVYRRLGLSVGLLDPEAPLQDKQLAYRADLTYGAGYEFGFDYLRDQLQVHQHKQLGLGESVRQQLRGTVAEQRPGLQRGHAVALIDEADSVLIDEATTPLLLSSGPTGSDAAAKAYLEAARVAAQLAVEKEYMIDPRRRRAQLTPRGVQAILDVEAPLPEPLQRPWPTYVEQALMARHFLCRDVDYVIENERVMLVDQSTGRIFADRSWRQGLHQAVEAKEGLPLTATRRTLARISRQQFFRLYDTLCGMTGTARQAERELWTIYRLPVVLIPTRKPCRRHVAPVRFFAAREAKYRGIVESVQERHATQQPILLGTRTIEESRTLADLLRDAGVAAELLNGTQDADEAEIVARAGQRGAVTIATNIAGRGTDIPLDPGVVQSGGLHVIAAEPNTSSRVDRQLVGRAARQGDPGSCQTFVSAEDELIRVFASRLARTMRRLADKDGEIHTDLSNELHRVQRSVERLSFELRRRLLESDAWRENVLAKLSGKQE